MAKKPTVAPEMKAADPIELLAIDAGNSRVKFKASNGILETFRSIQGQVSSGNTVGRLPFDWTITYGGASWVFSEAAYQYSESVEYYATLARYSSDWYKRLFAFTLHRAYGLRISEGIFYPHVVITLPPKIYKSKQEVTAIKANLVGEYRIENTLNGCLQVQIKPDHLQILPEGAPSFFYQLEYGKENGQTIYGAGLWLVCDVGGLTGSVTAFRDGQYIGEQADSDPQSGMLYIANKIAQFIRDSGGPDMDPSEYDAQLGCEAVTVNGNSYTITGVKASALKHVAERLERMLSKAAQGKNVAGILLTGGGADYVTLNPAGLPPIVRVANPRTANVEGAFNFLRKRVTQETP